MSIENTEIPCTRDGCKAYITEANKRLDYLRPLVSEFNRLIKRLKIAQEKLEKMGG